MDKEDKDKVSEKEKSSEVAKSVEEEKTIAEKADTDSPSKKQKMYEPTSGDVTSKDSKKRAAKDTKKDKKGKKEKDPNKPKRPLSGYFLFMADERNKVREEHPDWKTGDIGKELGKSQNTLDANRKKKYQDQADKAKAKYDKEMEKIPTKD